MGPLFWVHIHFGLSCFAIDNCDVAQQTNIRAYVRVLILEYGGVEDEEKVGNF
jgi:hypothetical protein